MRLIFVATGSYGHIFPMLPLAVAARDAGHDVVFGTAPDYHPALAAAGLRTLAVGSTIGAGIAKALQEDSTVPPAPRAFGDILARRMIADLAPLLASGAVDMVIYEALSPGAAIAARRAGVPAVCHGLGRVSDSAFWRALVATWLASAAQHHLSLPADFPEYLGNVYLDVCPPSIQSPRLLGLADRIPLRPTAWEQPGGLPPSVRDRDEDRPLIFVTLGTLLGRPEVRRTVLEGLAPLPVDVVMTLGNQDIGPDELGVWPANVTIERWVPTHAALPHVDLLVGHGGSGTMLETLAHGLPQLVLPQSADQFANAQVIADAGLGHQLLPAEVTAEAVGEHAAALLADVHVAKRVSEVADEIAGMPSAEDVIARLTRE